MNKILFYVFLLLGVVPFAQAAREVNFKHQEGEEVNRGLQSLVEGTDETPLDLNLYNINFESPAAQHQCAEWVGKAIQGKRLNSLRVQHLHVGQTNVWDSLDFLGEMPGDHYQLPTLVLTGNDSYTFESKRHALSILTDVVRKFEVGALRLDIRQDCFSDSFIKSFHQLVDAGLPHLTSLEFSDVTGYCIRSNFSGFAKRPNAIIQKVAFDAAGVTGLYYTQHILDLVGNLKKLKTLDFRGPDGCQVVDDAWGVKVFARLRGMDKRMTIFTGNQQADAALQKARLGR